MMLFRKVIFLLINLSTSCFANAQLSKEVSEISDSLAKATLYHYNPKGIDHQTSGLWQYAHKLDSIASTSELRTLLEHKNPVVRCYAFQSLCNRSAEVFQFLITHLNDYDKLFTRYYDLFRSDYVSNFYISEARKQLNEKQIKELDSTLIFDENCRLSFRTFLITNLPAEDKYYKIVRDAAKTGDGSALTTLAKFQKQEDKDLILSGYSIKENNYMLIRAIREFPDPSFYPYLTKKFRKNWSDRRYYFSEWRILYQALAKYPDEVETLKLFKKTLKTGKKFKRQTFCCYMKAAIIKYPNSKFDQIMAKIKLDNFHEEELLEIVNDYR